MPKKAINPDTLFQSRKYGFSQIMTATAEQPPIVPADSPPTSTWIVAQGLANKDFLVEVEAIALIE